MEKFYSIDPKDKVIMFGAIYLTGFAEGKYLNVTLDEDDFKTKSGAHGDTTRIRNRKDTGEVTITLQESSAVNTLLATHRLVDLATGKNVVPFVIKDTDGTMLIAAKASYILNAPDVGGGDDVENREWKIKLHGVRNTYFAGGKTPLV